MRPRVSSCLALATLVLALTSAQAQVTFTGGAPGAGPVSTLLTGFLSPSSISTDSSGNLYVGALQQIDMMDFTFYQTTIYKETLVNGSYTQSIIEGIGGSSPAYTAVDSAGNVYIAAPGQYAIYSVTTTGGYGYYPQSGPPQGIAADNAGHLFYSIGTTIRQLNIAQDSSTPVITGLNTP
jgi:hypothetical protein